MKNMFIRFGFISLLILLLQWLIIDRIVLFDLNGNIILILLSVVTLSYGRTIGVIYGFFIGLSYDILTGFIGIHALVFSIAGFLFGIFAIEGKSLKDWDQRQFLQVNLFVFFLSYLIFNGINRLYMVSNFWEYLFKFVIGQTVFTGLFLVLFSMVFWRNQR